MKKIMVVLLSIIFILSIALVGCGKSSQSTPNNSQTSNSSTTSQSETSQTQDMAVSSQDQVLSTGPHGEKATLATTLKLTDEEIAKIKEGHYTAAIVLHYAGNDWSTAQVEGLKDTFAKLGIKVVAVTDANFKAEKQVSDIENVLALKPNIIVSIPVDPVSTAPAYKKAAQQGVKLVFMDNVPDGLQQGKDYVSVVSADNYGNGVIAADIMAKNLGYKGKIGVIYYDANFFVTNQRVEAFEKTIKEKYPDIKIVARGGFTDPNAVGSVADAMLTKHPDLNGIFAVWDVPAEQVVASAKAAGRNDLVITTIDLGNNVAKIIAEGGLVKGLGAQRPYDQGVAEATLAAYALLGKEAPPYVAVPALAVTRDNILEAYKQVYHKDPPDFLVNAVKGK
ncbi:MAG: ribose transport system substrate-binding protein [Candidatus Petromonas sp.]|uniref:ABC-type sugar transport system, periplasmic component n=1 Tax=Thermoanaerobacter thermohydrosulfuricus WC1 TaxID=1198630 RepID=M8CXM2_THETY|nr:MULTISPECIES: substrate-binding domain-containing protein [Thermoanaerobacter]ABY92288.1 ABC-type sugar transport system periplasmic component-like protein [Thermoanaerobacter sp. X514]EMT39103.1 ABC-type sugar transport system, periplasmic component [Thermoanaerobacter thermohydrosulfuricus WC1]MDK2920341.1 ribose transport system substrate-binding protein [Candidatus Petromonas sp.]